MRRIGVIFIDNEFGHLVHGEKKFILKYVIGSSRKSRPNVK